LPRRIMLHGRTPPYDAAGMFLDNRRPAQAPPHKDCQPSLSPPNTSTYRHFDAAGRVYSGADIVIGALLPTTAAAYPDLAACALQHPTVPIVVRNGGRPKRSVLCAVTGAMYEYPLSAGREPRYPYLRLFVTPQGGSEIALASSYAFRTEHATETTALLRPGESWPPAWLPSSLFHSRDGRPFPSLVRLPRPRSRRGTHRHS